MITTDTLIEKVRHLINEAENSSGVSLMSDDTPSLDDTIRGLLPQAVALIQKNSNGTYVNAKALSPDKVIITTGIDGSASIALPADFVKLLSLRLSSWKKAALYISSPSSPEGLSAIDSSVHAGVFNPVCVSDVTEEGVKVVKLFPGDGTARVEHFIYEALFNPSEGLGICDSHMADAVAYACTALLYNIFEKHDASKSFMSLAIMLCGEENSVKR